MSDMTQPTGYDYAVHCVAETLNRNFPSLGIAADAIAKEVVDVLIADHAMGIL